MTELILGIDPGKTGALALLHPDGWLVDVVDMPSVTGAALGAQVADLLADFAPDAVGVAWVEKVHSMPKQGVASVWTFAEGYGSLLGALGALRVPVHHVTPQAWKRADEPSSVANMRPVLRVVAWVCFKAASPIFYRTAKVRLKAPIPCLRV